MAEIRVPTLGESVTEATIGKWFKKPGEAVAVDEPLVELETDKVTIEVPAPAAGVLSDIAAKDGETVAVGALLGQIKEGAGAPMPKPSLRQPGGRIRRPRPRPRLVRGREAAVTRAAEGGRPPSRTPHGAFGAQDSRRKRRRSRQGRRFRQGRPCHQGRHDGGDRARCSRPRRLRRPAPRRCARRRRPMTPRAKSA